MLLCSTLLASTLTLVVPDSIDTWNTSYVAQGVRPGVLVGLEFPMHEIERTKQRRRGPRTIHREVLIEPTFSTWIHRGNHTPMTLDGRFRTRRTREDGRQRELFFGFGGTYAFNAGKTYSFSDDGTLKDSRLAGRSMWSVNYGFGYGRTFMQSDGTELAWHVRPTLTLWVPYNTGTGAVWSIEMGIRRSWGSP